MGKRTAKASLCRAKKNLYVFEKLDSDKDNLDLGQDTVTIMNPQTCGIYKNGSDRYVVDVNGQRTDEIDNELMKQASLYQISGGK